MARRLGWKVEKKSTVALAPGRPPAKPQAKHRKDSAGRWRDASTGRFVTAETVRRSRAAQKGAYARAVERYEARAEAVRGLKVEKLVEKRADGATRTRYRAKLDRKLWNGDPLALPALLEELVRKEKGAGKGRGRKAYKRQHFIATFSGQETDPRSGRSHRATYGTGASTKLGTVGAELRSALQGLKEGKTAGGDPRLPRVQAQGYGKFATGPRTLELAVVEGAQGKKSAKGKSSRAARKRPTRSSRSTSSSRKTEERARKPRKRK